MSRRAIISDVHSNLLALEAVLADIKTQGVDGIVCLGDVCGYGPEPAECIALVRANTLWSLMGNHDEALFVEPKDFGKNARVAIEWQKRLLEPPMESTQDQEERWMWLQNLQPRRVESDVLFVHASPREPLYEYVLREDFVDDGFGPTQKAKDMFAAFQWLCFCGHSHRPGVVGQDFHWVRPEELKDATHILKRGHKTLINVGSVGQPRDAIPAACYCIFDYTEPADLTKTDKVAPLRDDMPPPPDFQAAETQRIAPLAAEEAGPTDDTRTSAELQKARDSLLMNLPRVTYRRVTYDIEAAQARFRLHPELPDSNALRLARGL